MSVVTLQLGQCGNQIGGQLFSTYVEDLNSCPATGKSKRAFELYNEESTERFFYRPESGDRSGHSILEARAVMVDMESKVISQTLVDAKSSGIWKYPEKQQFCQKRGSGNNWAHGYCLHGPGAKSSVMDMVRREVEKCDGFNGFLTLLSLAGGTGSGVGAYINQCLRDEYPHCFIMNQVVWPYNTGEVIVQNYNAVLTLSHLYQSSDAIIGMENDHLEKICKQLLGIDKVSFADINKVVSHKLASLLQPAYDSCKESSWTKSPVHCHLGRLLEHLVAHPEFKLLTLRNIPQMSENSRRYSSYQWHGLLKHLRQMLVANSPMEEGIDWQVKASSSERNFNHSLANLLILRGTDLPQADPSVFSDGYLYTKWMPAYGTFKTWAHPRPFNKYEKSAVLLSNSQSPVYALDNVVSKAWSMFASRAYVHQYLEHGLTEEDFVDSFACLEQVIASYKKI